jgi:cytochrome d ubiquinol oxidase subunit I
VHGGATAFTTLGFAGLYLVLGLLFVLLVVREIGHGPAVTLSAKADGPAEAAAKADGPAAEH